MREAGRVVARTLAAVADAARPGVRLVDLDELAADLIAQHGATPSFLGYHPTWAPTPYPGVLCLSVNDAIVHGIPDGRVLREGDLLSIDCGACIDGYHGDAAITVGVGDARRRRRTRLVDTTDGGAGRRHRGGPAGRPHRRHLARDRDGRPAPAATACRPDSAGTASVRRCTRIRTCPTPAAPGRGMLLREGLVLAIEPMLTEGGRDRGRTLADGWTVATDRRPPGRARRAHHRHHRRRPGRAHAALTRPGYGVDLVSARRSPSGQVGPPPPPVGPCAGPAPRLSRRGHLAPARGASGSSPSCRWPRRSARLSGAALLATRPPARPTRRLRRLSGVGRAGVAWRRRRSAERRLAGPARICDRQASPHLLSDGSGGHFAGRVAGRGIVRRPWRRR